MDMRTGKLYESAEDARAAGVPESDIAEIDAQGKLVKFFRESIKMRENPAFAPHQGGRERARRLAQQAK
jgi:hypothetical protein